jgi:hypothetical protein
VGRAAAWTTAAQPFARDHGRGPGHGDARQWQRIDLYLVIRAARARARGSFRHLIRLAAPYSSNRAMRT